MDDQTLMRRYQAGDEAAFNALYERYSGRVFGYLSRKIRESEAEDLYQKVWRTLHEKRGLYSDQPFAPWFFVMIRNLLIDEYRSLGRRKLPSVAPETESGEELDLEGILDFAGEADRELLEKYYLEERSYAYLSQELGKSPEGLRQQVSRALKKIRSRIG